MGGDNDIKHFKTLQLCHLYKANRCAALCEGFAEPSSLGNNTDGKLENTTRVVDAAGPDVGEGMRLLSEGWRSE